MDIYICAYVRVCTLAYKFVYVYVSIHITATSAGNVVAAY